MHITNGNLKLEGKHTLGLTPARHEVTVTLAMKLFDAKELGENGNAVPDEASQPDARLDVSASFLVFDVGTEP
ncbi:MAG: hypothetical protein WBD40_15120 [Tepidisphaeraceae bacterium]